MHESIRKLILVNEEVQRVFAEVVKQTEAVAEVKKPCDYPECKCQLYMQNRNLAAALMEAKNKLRGADIDVPHSVYRALDDFGG